MKPWTSSTRTQRQQTGWLWCQVCWMSLGVNAVPLSAVVQAQSTASEALASRLNEIIEREWEYTLRQHPEFASRLGERQYDRQWTDRSLEAFQKRVEHARSVLDELEHLNPERLPAAARLNYDLFKYEHEQDVEAHEFGFYLLPMDQLGGIQTAHLLADAIPFRSVDNYRDWLTRLRGVPTYANQVIILLETGIDRGIVQPRTVVDRMIPQIEKQVVDDPESSPFYRPFKQFPPGLSKSERRRLAVQARKTIDAEVVPAFQRLLTFVKDRYLPASAKTPSVSRLPRGDRAYAFLVQMHTTTPLSPKEIHNIGLQQVEQIRQQMDQVMRDANFDGSFEEFLEYLRSSPKFYYDDAQSLLTAYHHVHGRIEPRIMPLFDELPWIQCQIVAMPEAIAADAPAAMYRAPSKDGKRPGTVLINTSAPETRPSYEIPVLLLHEGMPGHHLQMALAMDLNDLPAFRRYGSYTAYSEGWALYAESLGAVIGMYDDPYCRFGQLSYDMWRSCRLVIDTGLHAFGWSRERAVEYLMSHTGKSEHEATNEIDRYMVMPGQALAYKIGALELFELRDRARTQLGAAFDIRDFHDIVLGNGPLPLDRLEEQVDTWIDSRRPAAGDLDQRR